MISSLIGPRKILNGVSREYISHTTRDHPQMSDPRWYEPSSISGAAQRGLIVTSLRGFRLVMRALYGRADPKSTSLMKGVGASGSGSREASITFIDLTSRCTKGGTKEWRKERALARSMATLKMVAGGSDISGDWRWER